MWADMWRAVPSQKPQGTLCVFFVLFSCRTEFISYAQEPCCECNCALQQMGLTKGGRYFQFSGIVRKQLGCFQVAHPLSCLSELQPSDIFRKCHRLDVMFCQETADIFCAFWNLHLKNRRKSVIKAAIGALLPSSPALIVLSSLPALRLCLGFFFNFQAVSLFCGYSLLL